MVSADFKSVGGCLPSAVGSTPTPSANILLHYIGVDACNPSIVEGLFLGRAILIAPTAWKLTAKLTNWNIEFSDVRRPEAQQQSVRQTAKLSPRKVELSDLWTREI